MNHFIYRLQILEHHLDNFGHVNNAVYLSLYEEARWDFITRNGYGLDVIMQRQKGPVILEARVRYRKELLNRDWITIRSYPEAPSNRKIMTIKQEMIREDGTLASEADFLVGYMDFKTRKLLSPDEDWNKAITPV